MPCSRTGTWGISGDWGTGNWAPGRGVREAGEGHHTVHQLLNHQGHHDDVQDLVESLHGVSDVPSQTLLVAQIGVQGSSGVRALGPAVGLLDGICPAS